jgi:hypothetical protein
MASIAEGHPVTARKKMPKTARFSILGNAIYSAFYPFLQFYRADVF